MLAHFTGRWRIRNLEYSSKSQFRDSNSRHSNSSDSTGAEEAEALWDDDGIPDREEAKLVRRHGIQDRRRGTQVRRHGIPDRHHGTQVRRRGILVRRDDRRGLAPLPNCKEQRSNKQ